MDKRKEQDSNTIQTTGNSPETQSNPFENGVKVDQEIQLAQEELEKEQEFKEAQTERD